MRFLRRLFGGNPEVVSLGGRSRAGRKQTGGEGATRRRWDATETNRLNEEHWKYTAGQESPINNDLENQLEVLRVRSQREVSNNAMLAGVASTFASDLVGKTGPRLICKCKSNPEYAKTLQEIWGKWFEECDVRGKSSGAELLRSAVFLYWPAGEFIFQIVNDPGPGTSIMGRGFKTKLYAIHPRRLRTPYGEEGGEIALGIRVDSFGRPVEYYFEQEQAVGAFQLRSGKFDRVRASDVIHDFLSREPDQVRGVPWTASNLGTIAELRDYDDQVLDGARLCASQTSIVYSDHPALEPIVIETGSTEVLERNTTTVLPPGWKPMFAPATQPAANYIPFRHERMREMGREIGMPLLTILLDAKDHNFSSARLDRLVYKGMLESHQDRIEHSTLDRCLYAVERESRLLGILGERPDDLYHEWIWPVIPEVDETKAAVANERNIKSGIKSISQCIREHSRDPEDVFEEIAEERHRLAALDIKLDHGDVIMISEEERNIINDDENA